MRSLFKVMPLNPELKLTRPERRFCLGSTGYQEEIHLAIYPQDTLSW